MKYLFIALSSVFSFIFIFFLTKIIGAREMSQLSMFDYINSITIGSLAADMALSPNDDFVPAIIAMSIYSLLSILFSVITNKSVFLRRFISGEPTVLMKNGKIYDLNFKRLRLDLGEFTAQCRINGFYDISQIDTATMEENGRISFLPKSENRPLSPGDMGVAVPNDELSATIIADGRAVEANLAGIGFDMRWLENRLSEQNLRREDIFLATCTQDGTISFFKRNGMYNKNLIG